LYRAQWLSPNLEVTIIYALRTRTRERHLIASTALSDPGVFII
jgi:hypothetical protein